MASFNDYFKELKYKETEEKVKEELDEQIWKLKENIDLRIEELKCAKDYFKLYDYLYILMNLKSAREKLTEAQDIITGWTKTPEEDIPEDMIFKGDEDD